MSRPPTLPSHQVRVTKQQLFSFCVVHGRADPKDPKLRAQSYEVFEDGVVLCRLFNVIFPRAALSGVYSQAHTISVSARAARNWSLLYRGMERLGIPIGLVPKEVFSSSSRGPLHPQQQGAGGVTRLEVVRGASAASSSASFQRSHSLAGGGAGAEAHHPTSAASPPQNSRSSSLPLASASPPPADSHPPHSTVHHHQKQRGAFSAIVLFYFLFHLGRRPDFSAEFAEDVSDELTAFLQSMESVRALVLGGAMPASKVPPEVRAYCTTMPEVEVRQRTVRSWAEETLLHSQQSLHSNSQHPPKSSRSSSEEGGGPFSSRASSIDRSERSVSVRSGVAASQRQFRPQQQQPYSADRDEDRSTALPPSSVLPHDLHPHTELRAPPPPTTASTAGPHHHHHRLDVEYALGSPSSYQQQQEEVEGEPALDDGAAFDPSPAATRRPLHYGGITPSPVRGRGAPPPHARTFVDDVDHRRHQPQPLHASPSPTQWAATSAVSPQPVDPSKADAEASAAPPPPPPSSFVMHEEWDDDDGEYREEGDPMHEEVEEKKWVDEDTVRMRRMMKDQENFSPPPPPLRKSDEEGRPGGLHHRRENGTATATWRMEGGERSGGSAAPTAYDARTTTTLQPPHPPPPSGKQGRFNEASLAREIKDSPPTIRPRQELQEHNNERLVSSLQQENKALRDAIVAERTMHAQAIDEVLSAKSRLEAEAVRMLEMMSQQRRHSQLSTRQLSPSREQLEVQFEESTHRLQHQVADLEEQLRQAAVKVAHATAHSPSSSSSSSSSPPAALSAMNSVAEGKATASSSPFSSPPAQQMERPSNGTEPLPGGGDAAECDVHEAATRVHRELLRLHRLLPFRSDEENSQALQGATEDLWSLLAACDVHEHRYQATLQELHSTRSQMAAMDDQLTAARWTKEDQSVRVASATVEAARVRAEYEAYRAAAEEQFQLYEEQLRLAGERCETLQQRIHGLEQGDGSAHAGAEQQQTRMELQKWKSLCKVLRQLDATSMSLCAEPQGDGTDRLYALLERRSELQKEATAMVEAIQSQQEGECRAGGRATTSPHRSDFSPMDEQQLQQQQQAEHRALRWAARRAELSEKATAAFVDDVLEPMYSELVRSCHAQLCDARRMLQEKDATLRDASVATSVARQRAYEAEQVWRVPSGGGRSLNSSSSPSPVSHPPLTQSSPAPVQPNHQPRTEDGWISNSSSSSRSPGYRLFSPPQQSNRMTSSSTPDDGSPTAVQLTGVTTGTRRPLMPSTSVETVAASLGGTHRSPSHEDDGTAMSPEESKRSLLDRYVTATSKSLRDPLPSASSSSAAASSEHQTQQAPLSAHQKREEWTSHAQSSNLLHRNNIQRNEKLDGYALAKERLSRFQQLDFLTPPKSSVEAL